MQFVGGNLSKRFYSCRQGVWGFGVGEFYHVVVRGSVASSACNASVVCFIVDEDLVNGTFSQ